MLGVDAVIYSGEHNDTLPALPADFSFCSNPFYIICMSALEKNKAIPRKMPLRDLKAEWITAELLISKPY
jgi:hypothetical protein